MTDKKPYKFEGGWSSYGYDAYAVRHATRGIVGKVYRNYRGFWNAVDSVGEGGMFFATRRAAAESLVREKK